MKELEIVIDPYKDINYVLLDGSQLSEYSGFNDYYNQPILGWVYKLGDIAQRQINDYYSLMIVGEEFDACFISTLMQSNELCKNCSYKPFIFNSPVEKRYDTLKKLAATYNCTTQTDKLSVYLSGNYNVKNDFIKQSEFNDAFVFIDSDSSIDLSKISDNKPHIILRTDDNTSIECIGRFNYIWRLPQNKIDSIITMLVDRFSKIPFIVQVSKELEGIGNLNDEEKRILKLASSINPLVKIDRIAKIEINKSAEIKASTIPEGYQLPNLKIVSKDLKVLMVDGMSLKALNVGSSVIEVFIQGENTACFRQTVDTYQDNTVKQITLDRAEPNMRIGGTQKIDMFYEPVDATDSSFIVWRADNPSVLQVDQLGNVTALSQGRAVVSASTINTNDSVIIDVLPNISQINLFMDRIKIMKGERKAIQVQFFPDKVFDPSYNWRSNNDSIAHVEINPDGTSAIVATEIGECDITCIANEGGCNSSCHVTVLDPVAEEKKRKNMIDTACIIGVPVILILLYLLSRFFGN